jgi:lipoprotein-anchoring transpeptidase ErfK/SrfK
VADVSGAVAEANALLASPLVVRGYDPIRNDRVEWTVEPAQWGTWLKLSVDPTDQSRLNWQFELGLVDAFLARQSDQLGEDRYFDSQEMTAAVTTALTNQTNASELRIYHREQHHTVQAGETLSSIGYDYGIPYPWIQQANPNVGDGLVAGQTITIPSLDLMIPLPVVENKRIVVSISQQRMWAYENGAVKWDWPASTGIDSSPTAPGIFQVQSHEVNAYAENWDLWMPHFMGIYRPVPTTDFMNGFHGFPTRNGANLLWTGSLGHQVTYGCILISSDNAVTLYDWAEEGVIVEIQR